MNVSATLQCMRVCAPDNVHVYCVGIIVIALDLLHTVTVL